MELKVSWLRTAAAPGTTLPQPPSRPRPPTATRSLSSETGFVTSQPHLYAKGKLSYDPETLISDIHASLMKEVDEDVSREMGR